MSKTKWDTNRLHFFQWFSHLFCEIGNQKALKWIKNTLVLRLVQDETDIKNEDGKKST